MTWFHAPVVAGIELSEIPPAVALPHAPLLTPRVDFAGQVTAHEVLQREEIFRLHAGEQPKIPAPAPLERFDAIIAAAKVMPMAGALVVVEVPASEILLPAFGERLCAIAGRGDVDAACLRLAVRETELANHAGLPDALDRIRAYGFRLALRGAASPLLGMNGRLRGMLVEIAVPITSLAHGTPECATYVQRMAVARACGMECVAMGVHAGDDARRARALGFDAISGPAALRRVRHRDDMFAVAA